jgi:hypothetical protein
MPDGVLQQISAHCWRGTLNGWRVDVGEDDEGWYVAICLATKGYARLILRAFVR